MKRPHSSTNHPAEGRTSWWKRSAPVSPVSIVGPGSRPLKYCLTALACLTVSTACIENGLSPYALLTLPLIVAALTRSDYSKPYLWSERVTTVVFVLYGLVVLAVIAVVHRRIPLPIFIVYFTFGTILARALGTLTDRNVSQLVFLTVGLVIINCILTNHLLFGLAIPVYLFALMAGLALFDAARSNRAAQEGVEPIPEPGSGDVLGYFGKITVILVACSAVVFVVLPRPYMMFPGLRSSMVRPDGMAELQQRISYRDMVGMADRERIAFVADLEEGELPKYPYWRGRVLENFDGKSWIQARESAGVPRFIQPPASQTIVYRFTPYKLQSSTIYCAGLPLRVSPNTIRRPLYISSNWEVRVDSPFLVASSYNVTSAKMHVPANHRQVERNLSTSGVTPQIERLAREWSAAAATPADKAKAIIQRFTSDYRYALEVPAPPEEANPLEYFLLQTKSGHCEYFAGAFCLMLRSLGVPARVVEGFAGAEPGDGPNQYTVRFANAHAWVEAMVTPDEWTTLDPTPPSADQFGSRLWRATLDAYDTWVRRWIKYVVYFDRNDQRAMLQGLTDVMEGEVELTPKFLEGAGVSLRMVVVGALALLTLALVAYRLLGRAKTPATVYSRTMRELERKGLLSKAHPWHEANSMEIKEKFPDAAKAVDRFTRIYYEARFGGHGAELERLMAAREELLRSLASKPRKAA